MRKQWKSTITVPVERTHFLTNFLFFVNREKVRHFAGIKKITDVLKE